ncbi:hypothetical protein [Candidatus Pantoea multigeneris]|uniref:Uncharacterized protein n=1 Tax=Candidatus Pantoea multigeneris TaxID=2608357 RepID=A0ABX0RB09_9GAMM|nr:hypothetical protein [Pantoea multigeneris]NIF21718.1 hypothetical protein [Pantoea multigeneris]
MSDYDVLNQQGNDALTEDDALTYSQGRLMEETSLLSSEVSANPVIDSPSNKGAVILAKTMLPVFQRMIYQLLHAYFIMVCEQYLKPLDKIEQQLNEVRSIINDDTISLSRKIAAFRSLIDSLDTGWSDDVSATLTAFDGLSLKISTALSPEDIPAMLDTFINVLSLPSVVSHVDKDFLSYWREHLVSLKQHIQWSVRIYTAPRNSITDYLNLIFDSALLPEWATEFIHQVQDLYLYLQQWVAELGEGELPGTLAWIKGYTQAYSAAGSPGERMKVMFHMLQHEEVMQIIYPLIRQKIPLIAEAFQTLDTLKLEASEIDLRHGSVATSLDYFLRVTDDKFTQKLMEGSEDTAGENRLHIGREVGAILRQAGQYTQAGSYSGMLFKNMLKVMQSDMGWIEFVKACASETQWWDLTVSLLKTGVDYSLGAFVAAINIVNLGWNSEFVATWGSMTWRQLPAAALKNLSDELNKKDSALLKEVERFPLLGAVIKTLMLLLNDLSNKDNWLEILISRLSEYIRDVPLIKMLDKLIKLGLMWQLWQVSRLQGTASSLEEKKQAIQQAQSTLYTYMQYFPEQDLRMLQPMISWLPMIRTAWDLSVGVPQVEDHASLLNWGAELLSNVESQAEAHPTPAVVALQNEMAAGLNPVIDIALGAGAENILADNAEEASQQAGVTPGFLQQQRAKIAQLSAFDVTKWLNKEEIGNFTSSTLRTGKNNAISALRKFNTLGTSRVSSVRNSVIDYFTNKGKTDDLTLQGFEEISLNDDVTEPAELRSAVQTFIPQAASAWRNLSQYTRGQGQEVYQRWQNMSSTKKNAIKGVAIGSAVIAGGAGLYALFRNQEHAQGIPEFEHPEEQEAYRNQLIGQLTGIEKRRKIAKGVSLGSGVLSLLISGMGAGIRAGKVYDAYRRGEIPEDELSATPPDLVGREAEQAADAQHEAPQGVLSRLKATLNNNERLFWSVGAALLLPATVGGYYWWRYAQQAKNLHRQLEMLDEKEEGSGSELLALTAERLLETLGDDAATASPEQIRAAMQQADTENNKYIDAVSDIQNDGTPFYARHIHTFPQERQSGPNSFAMGSGIRNKLRENVNQRDAERRADEAQKRAETQRLAEANRDRDWQSMSTEEILSTIVNVSYQQRCKAYEVLSGRKGVNEKIKIDLIEIGMVYDPVLNKGSARALSVKNTKGYLSWGNSGKRVIGILRDKRGGVRSFPLGRYFHLDLEANDEVKFSKNYLPKKSYKEEEWHADISQQINKDMEGLPENYRARVGSISDESYNTLTPEIIDEVSQSTLRNVFVTGNNSLLTDATWRLEKMPQLMSKSDAESDFPSTKVFLITAYDRNNHEVYKKSFIPQKYRENFSYSETERSSKRAETLKNANWKRDVIEQFQEECKGDRRLEGLSIHWQGGEVLYCVNGNSSISKVEGRFSSALRNTEIFVPKEVKIWINVNAPEVSLDSLITITQYSENSKAYFDKQFPVSVALSPGFNTLNLFAPTSDHPGKIVNWEPDSHGWVMQNYNSGMTEEDFKLSRSLTDVEVNKRANAAFDEVMKENRGKNDAIAMLDARTWLDKQIIDAIKDYGVPENTKIDLEQNVKFFMKSQRTAKYSPIRIATGPPIYRNESLSLRETILKNVVLSGVIKSDEYSKNHIMSTSWPGYLQSRERLLNTLNDINFEKRYVNRKKELSAEDKNIQRAIIKPQVDKALTRVRRYQGITVDANPAIRLLHNEGPVIRTVVHGVFVVNCKDSQMKNILALLSTRDDRPPLIIHRLDDLKRNDNLIEWLKPHLHLDEESYRLKEFSLGTQRYTLNQVYEQMREWQIAKVARDIDTLVETSTEVYIEFFKNLGGQLLQFLAFPLTFLGLAGVPYMVTTGLVAFAVLGLAPTLISYLAADTPEKREALGQELEAMVISELFGLFLGKITAPILKGIGNGVSASLKNAKKLVTDLQQRANKKLFSKLTNPGEEVTKKLNSSEGRGRLTSTQKNILNGINESLGKNVKSATSDGVSHTENVANLMTGSYDYQFKGNLQALIQEILKEDEGN